MGAFRNIYIVGLTLLLLSASVFVVMQNKESVESLPSQKVEIPHGDTHVVVLRDTGYDPSELSIKKGDMVQFSTDRGFEHWPASNLHPTHNMYSDFDPKHPIASDESWSFQFTKVGTWSFHDHLNSTFTGSITVSE